MQDAYLLKKLTMIEKVILWLLETVAKEGGPTAGWFPAGALMPVFAGRVVQTSASPHAARGVRTRRGIKRWHQERKEGSSAVTVVWYAPAVLLALLLSFTPAFSETLPPLPSDAVFWVDHYGGFDVDDFFAHVVESRHLGSRLVGMSTQFYHPDEKARLTRLLLDEMGLKTIPVHAGMGIYPGQEEYFLDRYPAWPPEFGSPYSRQGEAFRDVYGTSSVLAQQYDHIPAVDAMRRAAKAYARRLVIIAQGPLTNIARALQEDPTIAADIERLVLMGGWFQDSVGKVTRIGYNTMMDLGAARKVFGCKGLRTIVVNSQTIADAHVVIRRVSEFPLFVGSSQTALAQALFRDMANWAEHSQRTMSDIVLADPVTAAVAIYPNLAARCRSVRISIRRKGVARMYESGHMAVLEVSDAEDDGQVLVVDSLVEPAGIRAAIVRELGLLAFPGAWIPRVHLDRFGTPEGAQFDAAAYEKHMLLTLGRHSAK